MSRFKIGQELMKIVGYPFRGKVVATYENEEKCSVRHADGWDHIFHDKLLAPYSAEYEYLRLAKHVLETGDFREGRNGGTYSSFGGQLRFDLSQGFPLLTTKRVFLRGLVAELLWFISGDTNNKTLTDQGVHIWDEWAGDDGHLGPIYGAQWRRWGEKPCWACFGKGYDDDNFTCEVCMAEGVTYIDQLKELLEGLVNDPYGRRHLISAWNPEAIPAMVLPPCHCTFQFHVAKGKLSCHLYQRSADLFLGVPFNIASYALLTHLIAREVGLEVGDFIHSFGDVHIYGNHVEQMKLQMTREPRPFPQLVLGDAGLFDIKTNEISVTGYDPHPAIKGEVSR